MTRSVGPNRIDARRARCLLLRQQAPLSCEDQEVMSLPDLQAKIAETRASRGFTTDPVHLVVLLAEELGEVAREVKKRWSTNYDAFDGERLAPELADTFVLLSALASEVGVDLETAIDQKFFTTDAERTWRSAT